MKENVSGCFFSEHSVQFLFYTHFITTVMPPGPVSCIGGTKYPHCIVLYGIVFASSDYLLTTYVSETFRFVILCFGKILL